MIAWFRRMLAALEPSDFAGDPYGEATNQAGHSAIIGTPAALLLLATGLHPMAVPLAVCAVYLLLWEGLCQPGTKWADSLQDAANVTAGASVIVGALHYGYGTACACVAVWLASVALGAWRRS